MTRGIRVRVRSKYLSEKSRPDQNGWLFGYTVRISNESELTVRLVSRHWIITDGNGEEQHVRGPGVVGQNPLLAPGVAFEYSSFCPLPTPVGSMRGTFQMEIDGGGGFDAEIGSFMLAEPHAIN